MIIKTNKFPVAVTLALIFAANRFVPLEAQKNTTDKPNVIIIFADDMGYGDVSYLNPEARTYTPNLDRLAENSIIFRNAHASASVCTPSRYGLLTGRYAWRSEAGGGVISGFDGPVIEHGRETIASLFNQAGYSTACIGKWHLGLRWHTKNGIDKVSFNSNTGFSNVDYDIRVTYGPNDFGFDYSFVHPASLDMPPYVFVRNHLTIDPEVMLTSDIYPETLDGTEYSWDRISTRAHDVYWRKGVWWRRGEISRTFRIENCLTKILNEGISFIENHTKQEPTEPFFLYLPLTGPHTPWMPTDEFKGKSSIKTYGDFIMNIDHVVGQVEETLRRLNIYDNTMIVFSSDNGAKWPQEEIDLQNHNSNWGRRGQKGDVWDGGHRIPLIISWPSQNTNQIIYDHLVSLTDLFATFASLIGVDSGNSSGEDSFSFLHVLNGDTSKITRRDMIHQSSEGVYSIRRDGWKFIDGLGSGGFTEPVRIASMTGEPAGQLYHIKSDTLESTNLFLTRPDIVYELKKELNKQVEKKTQ